MPQRQQQQYQVSLDQLVQRVREAWFAQAERNLSPGDPGFPAQVFPDHLIVERADGFMRVDYTVNEDGTVLFGDAQMVEQEFVPARNPVQQALNALKSAYRALTQSSTPAVSAAFHSASRPAPASSSLPGPVRAAGEGLLLQIPFRVYSGDSDEERYVGGVVLEPGDDNAYGDIWEAADIRRLAHRFMETSQHEDYMHTSKQVARPVESQYLPTADEGGQDSYHIYGEDIAGGSWWLGSRVTDDDTWEKVKNGELTGYSIFAVKVDTGESLGHRAYASPREAPRGRTMSADEWDVTMVSLVDQPAVRKARFVKMLRDNTGNPVVQDGQGERLDEATLQALTYAARALTRYLEQQQHQHGGYAMKPFQQQAQYDTYQGDSPQPDQSRQYDDNPPADPEPTSANAPEAPGSETGEDPVLAEVTALRGEVQQLGQRLDSRLQEQEQRTNALEHQQRRNSGAGALPNGPEEDPDNQTAYRRAPSWVSVGGSKPRRDAE